MVLRDFEKCWPTLVAKQRPGREAIVVWLLNRAVRNEKAFFLATNGKLNSTTIDVANSLTAEHREDL
jgi:hypothetical protein